MASTGDGPTGPDNGSFEADPAERLPSGPPPVTTPQLPRHVARAPTTEFVPGADQPFTTPTSVVIVKCETIRFGSDVQTTPRSRHPFIHTPSDAEQQPTFEVAVADDDMRLFLCYTGKLVGARIKRGVMCEDVTLFRTRRAGDAPFIALQVSEDVGWVSRLPEDTYRPSDRDNYDGRKFIVCEVQTESLAHLQEALALLRRDARLAELHCEIDEADAVTYFRSQSSICQDKIQRLENLQYHQKRKLENMSQALLTFRETLDQRGAALARKEAKANVTLNNSLTAVQRASQRGQHAHTRRASLLTQGTQTEGPVATTVGTQTEGPMATTVGAQTEEPVTSTMGTQTPAYIEQSAELQRAHAEIARLRAIVHPMMFAIQQPMPPQPTPQLRAQVPPPAPVPALAATRTRLPDLRRADIDSQSRAMLRQYLGHPDVRESTFGSPAELKGRLHRHFAARGLGTFRDTSGT